MLPSDPRLLAVLPQDLQSRLFYHSMPASRRSATSTSATRHCPLSASKATQRSNVKALGTLVHLATDGEFQILHTEYGGPPHYTFVPDATHNLPTFWVFGTSIRQHINERWAIPWHNSNTLISYDVSWSTSYQWIGKSLWGTQASSSIVGEEHSSNIWCNHFSELQAEARIFNAEVVLRMHTS